MYVVAHGAHLGTDPNGLSKLRLSVYIGYIESAPIRMEWTVGLRVSSFFNIIKELDA